MIMASTEIDSPNKNEAIQSINCTGNSQYALSKLILAGHDKNFPSDHHIFLYTDCINQTRSFHLIDKQSGDISVSTSKWMRRILNV